MVTLGQAREGEGSAVAGLSQKVSMAIAHATGSLERLRLDARPKDAWIVLDAPTGLSVPFLGKALRWPRYYPDLIDTSGCWSEPKPSLKPHPVRRCKIPGCETLACKPYLPQNGKRQKTTPQPESTKFTERHRLTSQGETIAVVHMPEHFLLKLLLRSMRLCATTDLWIRLG